MGSCECVGNGSGCKCSSIDSKVNLDNESMGKKFWKQNKNWMITTFSGLIITAYSLSTFPDKNNEKINYDQINNQLRSIESYEQTSKKYPLDNIDIKFKKENLDYYKYALKEDSASIASSYEFKSYNDNYEKSENAVSLGLLFCTTGMFMGIYSLRKILRNKSK